MCVQDRMDKIYSRNRIKIPSFNYGKNILLKKFIKTFFIIIIAFIVMINILRAVDPVFTEVCKYKAKETVITEINRITTENMIKYQDSNMINIVKDESGNIKMLQVNSTPLNNMISDIVNDIQVTLNDNSIVNTGIPFGSITGIKYISALGPIIPLRISSVGTIDTKIRNEFNESGINQTVHRLWLDINCRISILSPYKIEETEVNNEVILSENVIIGGVPNVYVDTNK